MTDYKKMYLTLCDAVASAMDEMQSKPELTGIFLRLMAAMNKAENIYIETTDDVEELEE